ncbi:MAG: site-2 protease family protein [Chloroflexota bacterium]|nr:site-2 protease family protein [Chloroflexota bacterium]MDE3192631.1 site-2 protease family protein [Chloroflexota bacterium]
MPGSILIARIFGIDIRIHLSWFLIFGLLLFTLSDPSGGLFRMQRPQWSDQKLVIVAAITALLFFASVLSHELAHALVARTFRMPVSSITLFLLGGVANLRKEPPSARAEFLMAAAGPGTSLVLGGIGIAISGFGGDVVSDVSALDPVVVVANYLGYINVALAVFNMIPGFPLDGGRVLRSIVWGITHDRARATGIAARGGQVVAALLLVYGIWRAVADQDAFGGVWMGMIAYFLYTAASNSLEQERVATAVRGVQVQAVMTQQFLSVRARTPLAELVYGQLVPHNARAVAVLDGERLIGLVTIADLQKVDQSAWPQTPVEEVMTPASHLPAVSSTTRLMTAIESFASSAAPVLPVVDNGALVGMLDRDTVASYIRMRETLGIR